VRREIVGHLLAYVPGRRKAKALQLQFDGARKPWSPVRCRCLTDFAGLALPPDQLQRASLRLGLIVHGLVCRLPGAHMGCFADKIGIVPCLTVRHCANLRKSPFLNGTLPWPRRGFRRKLFSKTLSCRVCSFNEQHLLTAKTPAATYRPGLLARHQSCECQRPQNKSPCPSSHCALASYLSTWPRDLLESSAFAPSHIG